MFLNIMYLFGLIFKSFVIFKNVLGFGLFLFILFVVINVLILLIKLVFVRWVIVCLWLVFVFMFIGNILWYFLSIVMVLLIICGWCCKLI